MDAKKRAQARLGRTLDDKWLVERLLGCGGMAAVYAATHRNGKRAAIKMLHPELGVHADFRRRFLREGYLANSVGHDGAVSVLDDAVDGDGSVYLVMELLEGQTLGARWEELGRRMSAQAILPIADAVLDVLGAAHAKGIVHRDVKPDNVFLTVSGVVKLLDFGIARLREAGAMQQTASGMTMGTPTFMPPEQARGRWKEIDARTDLWAVGALLWTCLTGRFVHSAETVNEVLLRAMTAHAPRFATIAPGAPSGLARLVDRALEFEPARRFASAKEMQAELREVLQSLREGPVVTLSIDPGASDSGPTIMSDSSAGERAMIATTPSLALDEARRERSGSGRRVQWVAMGGVATALIIGTVLVLGSRRGPEGVGLVAGKPAASALPAAVIAAVPSAEATQPVASAAPPTASSPADVAAPSSRASRPSAPAAPASASASASAAAAPRASAVAIDPHDLRQ